MPEITLTFVNKVTPTAKTQIDKILENMPEYLLADQTDADNAGISADAAEKPAIAAGKPAIAAGKPADAAMKPAIAAGKPAIAAGKPAIAAGKPAIAAGKPAEAAGIPADAAGILAIAAGIPGDAVPYDRECAIYRTFRNFKPATKVPKGGRCGLHSVSAAINYSNSNLFVKSRSMTADYILQLLGLNEYPDYCWTDVELALIARALGFDTYIYNVRDGSGQVFGAGDKPPIVFYSLREGTRWIPGARSVFHSKWVPGTLMVVIDPFPYLSTDGLLAWVVEHFVSSVMTVHVGGQTELMFGEGDQQLRDLMLGARTGRRLGGAIASFMSRIFGRHGAGIASKTLWDDEEGSKKYTALEFYDECCEKIDMNRENKSKTMAVRSDTSVLKYTKFQNEGDDHKGDSKLVSLAGRRADWLVKMLLKNTAANIVHFPSGYIVHQSCEYQHTIVLVDNNDLTTYQWSYDETRNEKLNWLVYKKY